MRARVPATRFKTTRIDHPEPKTTYPVHFIIHGAPERKTGSCRLTALTQHSAESENGDGGPTGTNLDLLRLLVSHEKGGMPRLRGKPTGPTPLLLL